MKKILSKIGAGFLGAVMTGASLLVPVAIADSTANTLADYPAPFITDGGTDMLMVIGADASPKDVLGAVNIAVELGGEPEGEPVPTGAATTAVTGGEEEEVALGEALNSVWGSALDDSDLTGFIDDEVEVNDTDYDVEETLSFTGDAKIASSFEDADFGKDIALVTEDEEAIKYKYVFEDVLPFSEVSENEPLEINFMGEPLKIVGLTDDTVKLSMAQKETLLEGESMTVGDYTVTLDRVGASAVRVAVTDGTSTQTETISGDSDEGEVEFDRVGDFKVDVVDGTIFYIEGSSDNSAKLELGEETTKTYDEGDGIVPLGEPENSDDAAWVWNIEDNSTHLTSLTAEYNVQADDADEEVVLLGENLVSPNEHFTVDLDSATTEEYTGYTVSFDDDLDLTVEDDGDVENQKAMVFESDLGEGFDLAGTEAKKVFLTMSHARDNTDVANVSVNYQDKDNDNYLEENLIVNESTIPEVVGTSEIDVPFNSLDLNFDLNNEDTTINVTMDGTYSSDADGVVTDSTVDNVFLVDKSGNEIALDVEYSSGDPVQLGTSSEDAQGTDLSYNSTVDDDYDTKLGGKENDFRTEYGAIVLDPEDNAGNDIVELSVPDEQVKVNVIVSGPGTEVTTTEGDTVTPKVEPVRDNIARLDSDTKVESDKLDNNLILVGGPCANDLVASLAEDGKTLSCDDWLDGTHEGEARIQLLEGAFTPGKVALVVAGLNAKNTQAACSVLQQYNDYPLAGTGMKVTGTGSPNVEELAETAGNSEGNQTE